MFQFLNCTQVILSFHVPKEWVRAVIPSAFEPYGITTTTGAVAAFAKECPRTVGDNQTFGKTSEYWTWAFAHPKNESWTEAGVFNYYLLDFATSSNGLAERLLSLGIRSDVGQISYSTNPLPTGGNLVEWNARTQNYAAKFHHRAAPDHPQWSGGDFHLWTGPGPFQRIDYQMIYYVDTVLAEGELVLEGDSRLGKILHGPVTAWDGTVYKDFSNTWRFNGTYSK